MGVGNDIASGNEQGNAALYRGDGNGLGFRQVASAGFQKAGNRSGRGMRVHDSASALSAKMALKRQWQWHGSWALYPPGAT